MRDSGIPTDSDQASAMGTPSSVLTTTSDTKSDDMQSSIQRKRLAVFSARRAVLIGLALVIIGAGIFATHQFLTYGALSPSIAGGWYGAYYSLQTETHHYIADNIIYIVIVSSGNNQLSVTTSGCSSSTSTAGTQRPKNGVTLSGSINGDHFTLNPPESDLAPDLVWVGTYSPDALHIDFYHNGNVMPNSPYADMKRGTYNDYLTTCKIK